MIIRKMDIKGFGNLQNKLFLPGSGMNLVFGPNESGKSTLMAFIRGMLYGVKGGRRNREGQLPPLKQYAPWHKSPYAGILEYTLDNGDSFRVGRNFEKGSLNIHDMHANNVTSLFPADRDGARFAEAHLGVDEAAFERTLFVSQLGTSLDVAGRKVLYEKLVNMRETGNEDISLQRATNALRKAMMDQVGSDRSTTRPLDRLDAQISVLEDEERLERERRNRLMESIAAKQETIRKIEQQSKMLETQRAQLQQMHKWAKISGLSARLNRLKELHRAVLQQEQELKNVVEEQLQITDKLEKLRAFSEMDPQYIKDLPVDYGRLCTLRESVQDLHNRLLKEQMELDAFSNELKAETRVIEEEGDAEALVEEWYAAREAVGGSFERTQVIEAVLGPKKSLSKWMPLVALLTLLSVALVVVGLVLHVPLAWIAGAVFSVSGTVACIWLLVRERKQNSLPEANNNAERHWNEIRKRMDHLLEKAEIQSVTDLVRMLQHIATRKGRHRALSNHLESLRLELTRVSNEKDLLEQKMVKMLTAVGIVHNGPITSEEMTEFSQLGTSFFEFQAALSACRFRKEGLQNGVDTLYREAALLCGLNITIRADLEDVISKLTREVHRIQEETTYSGKMGEPMAPEILADEITASEHQLEELRLQLRTHETRLEFLPQEERLQEIAEELVLLHEKRQALIRYGNRVKLAMDALEAAGKMVRRSFAPDFNAKVSQYMQVMTGGRYRNIRADDGLSMQIEMDGLEELASLPMLSGGTIDQAYLAMRLAAIAHLETNGESLPIFLDEPFSQYDEERMERTIQLFRDLAKTRQIFLFSCKERERDVIREAFKNENFHELSL